MTRAVHAIALAATARTALAAARAVADRRAGRDASAQEDTPVARADLDALRAEVAAAAVQLRLRAAVAPPADPDARLTQAFETRLVVADAARALALAHRKLLSLYPSVSAGAVEATRVLASETAALVAADVPDLGALASRLAEWTAINRR